MKVERSVLTTINEDVVLCYVNSLTFESHFNVFIYKIIAFVALIDYPLNTSKNIFIVFITSNVCHK